MIGNKYITNRFATDYIQKYIYWVDQPLRSMAPLRLAIYEIIKSTQYISVVSQVTNLF